MKIIIIDISNLLLFSIIMILYYWELPEVFQALNFSTAKNNQLQKTKFYTKAQLIILISFLKILRKIIPN